MTRWIGRSAAMLVTLLSVALLVSPPALAEPPVHGKRVSFAGAGQAHNIPLSQGSGTGYTLHYGFSSDPTDNTYNATFSPDVSQIVAWLTVTADGGADEDQFTFEVDFIAPDGSPVDSQWYENDTGTVTTYPDEQDTFGDANVARKYIDVAGTPNAQLTGQWTVNISAAGKLVASVNFTLEDQAAVSQSETAANAQQKLVDAGYDVIEFSELKGNSGNLFAFTIMTPVSQDLYSSATTQQIVDGLAALRQSFPNSVKLYTFLRYDPRYEVAYFAEAEDVQSYLDSNDFDTFADTIGIDVYDNETGEYLGESSKDFIKKNFGAGNYQNPPNPPLSKTSTNIGSVRLTISPTSLPADGTSKAVVSVEVFDKRNQLLPNVEVTFELSGSGEGAIRPRVTSTDETGKADAVFTAGKKNGTVTITATAGGVSGAGVITLGSGSTDQAQDNVITFLSGKGLQATEAGFMDADKTTAGVLIDLGSSYNVNQLVPPIVYGMAALRIEYSDAKNLVVLVPYKNNLIYLPATAQEYDTYSRALVDAATTADKDKVHQNFVLQVMNNGSYIDRQGKRISTFKDFYNQNFTGS